MPNFNEGEFLGSDGHVYVYSPHNGEPIRVAQIPIQYINDVNEAKCDEVMKWDQSGNFRINGNFGKNLFYLMSIRHPIIEFYRIIEKLVISVNDEVIQSFSGRSLVLYNILHNKEYFDRGLLVVPFIPYGDYDPNEYKNSAVEFTITASNLSQESHLKYESLLEKFIGAIFIPDISYIVQTYLGFQYEESNVIDVDLQVCSQRKIGGDVAIPNYPTELEFYQHGLMIDEFILPCEEKNFHKTIPISFHQPINQICIAFWEEGNFPNFLPVQMECEFHNGAGIRVHTNHKKALIFDKIPHKISYDQKKPIYTITFSNPKLLEAPMPDLGIANPYEEKKIIHSRRNHPVMRGREIVEQLIPGTLFRGIGSDTWLNIYAQIPPRKKINVGVWIIGTQRIIYQLCDFRLYRFSFVNSDIKFY